MSLAYNKFIIEKGYQELNQKGFTLVEVMIVVAIVGILSAIGYVQYQNYIAKAQLNETIVLAKNLSNHIILNLEAGSCSSEIADENVIEGKYARVSINTETTPWSDTAAIFPTNCYVNVFFYQGYASISPILKGKTLSFSVLNNGTMVVNMVQGEIRPLLPKSLL